MICHVLDITRTVSRIGRGFPTGIDRVERAYILEFLERFPTATFICKLTKNYVVISTQVMREFAKSDFGKNLNYRIGMYDALRYKLPKSQRRARSFLRSNAFVSFKDGEILHVLKQSFPDGFEYTNVGHSNLSVHFLSKLKPAGCTNIRVMIHDTILLDFPQYCREETTKIFSDKMESVMSVADVIVCNSMHTKECVQRHFRNSGKSTSYTVAHLGVSPEFKKQCKEDGALSNFVILGTIEIRKNHSFLLDVWEKFAKIKPYSEIPTLHIIGKRGWKNDAFFKRLDASPLYGKKIIEHKFLDDKQLQKTLNSATALLFPSSAEGFGLPAIEALAVGLPVICSDIPVFKELLADSAHILPVNSHDDWVEKIIELSEITPKFDTDLTQMPNQFKIPTWSAHFCHVLGAKV